MNMFRIRQLLPAHFLIRLPFNTESLVSILIIYLSPGHDNGDFFGRNDHENISSPIIQVRAKDVKSMMNEPKFFWAIIRNCH